MDEYIEREGLLKWMKEEKPKFHTEHGYLHGITVGFDFALKFIEQIPAADVVDVVRCKDCKFATELDKHCDINRTAYKHCSLLRGDETKYVWHKYKKYYKDYSIVSLDDFCSCGERRSEDESV